MDTVVFFCAETPVHGGTSQEVSDIELAHVRDRVSGLPFIPASTVKGGFRAFGVARDSGPQESAVSSFALSDAELFLLPVRSMHGMFAWVTSPSRCQRLASSLSDVSPGSRLQEVLCAVPELDFSSRAVAYCSSHSRLARDSAVVLEEFSFRAEFAERVAELGRLVAQVALPAEDAFLWWRTKLASDIVVVTDEDFHYFCSLCLELQSRAALDERRLIARGSLRFEEYLPAESVLYSKATSPNGSGEWPSVVQIGRGAAVGKGYCRVCAYKGGSATVSRTDADDTTEVATA